MIHIYNETRAKAGGLQLYLKKTPAQTFSCKILKIFKNTYFDEQLRTTTSIYEMVHIYKKTQAKARERFQAVCTKTVNLANKPGSKEKRGRLCGQHMNRNKVPLETLKVYQYTYRSLIQQ